MDNSTNSIDKMNKKYHQIIKFYEDQNDNSGIWATERIKLEELKSETDWQHLIIDCFANPPIRGREGLFLSLSYNIRFNPLNNTEYNFYKRCKESLDSIIEFYKESEMLMKFTNNDIINPRELMEEVFINKMKIKDFYKTFPGFIDLSPLSLEELNDLINHINLKLEETKLKLNNRIIKIDKQKGSQLYNELKIYFEELDYISLENALKGYILNEPILFNGSQNQLAEVFLRLKYNDLLESSNKEIINWLCTNFTFKDKKDDKIKPFNKTTVQSSFKKKGEVSRDNIILDDLKWLPYLDRQNRRI